MENGTITGACSEVIELSLPENIAYSTQYSQMRRAAMDILDEANFIVEERNVLRNGDIAIFRRYEKVIDHCRFLGSRFFLNRNGKTVYSFDMSIDSGSLISKDVIEHRNGEQYLLFRTELYGYSVLELHSLKTKHYIPNGRIEGKESFIWCDATYCPNNDLLYVTGCYWAHPGSTLIVDFSQPEGIPFREYDLMNSVDDFEEDIDPIRWEVDGSLTYQMAGQINTLSKQKLFSLLSGLEERGLT